MIKRIEICGGIAAGKTSLAQILEKEGFLAIYERFEDNPFLSEFYSVGKEDNTLETELVFTLLHYNWIKQNKGKKKLVCDYSLFQDYCYAINNLKQGELEAFLNLYNYLIKEISSVELIIYLKCNIDCLLRRIKVRNREMERNISREYLETNIATIERNLLGKDNVLIIESDKYNFIGSDRDIVLEMINNYCENA